MGKRSSQRAYTVVELLASMIVIVVVFWLLVPRRAYVNSRAIRCANNLKNMGLAFRIFANNNNVFPGQLFLTNALTVANIEPLSAYLALTNEISTPRILYCPADEKRSPANSFTNLTLKNLSYFVSLTTRKPEIQAFLAGDRNLQTNGTPIGPGLFAITSDTPLTWSKQLHGEEGHIAMSDGSVHTFSSSRLAIATKEQQLESQTNWLVIP